jgi:hypothetical protein
LEEDKSLEKLIMTEFIVLALIQEEMGKLLDIDLILKS